MYAICAAQEVYAICAAQELCVICAAQEVYAICATQEVCVICAAQEVFCGVCVCRAGGNMCRTGGMCAAQEVFCGVCAAQEVIMFRVGGLCGVCAAAGLYLWATVAVWLLRPHGARGLCLRGFCCV